MSYRNGVEETLGTDADGWTHTKAQRARQDERSTSDEMGYAGLPASRSPTSPDVTRPTTYQHEA
jgi:hypothetical protein